MFLENNIALSSAELQTLLLSLKAQRTQDDSWFYCQQVQEIPHRSLPKTVLYQDHVDKGEALSKHRYKETRILLIPSPKKKLIKLKYVEAILMFIFSIVRFSLQCGS